MRSRNSSPRCEVLVYAPAGDQGPVSGVDLPHAAGPYAEMFRLDIDTPFGWTSLVNSFAISWQRRSWLVKRFEGKRTIRVSFGLAWKSRCASRWRGNRPKRSPESGARGVRKDR